MNLYNLLNKIMNSFNRIRILKISNTILSFANFRKNFMSDICNSKCTTALTQLSIGIGAKTFKAN